MIYLLVYGTVGILLVVFRKWLSRKHPTFEDILDRVGDSELKRIESMQYPDGLPFSVRSARFVRNAIELLVVILCWPVLAVILLRRFSSNPDPSIEESDEFTDHGVCVRETTLQEIKEIEHVRDDDGGAPHRHLDT